MLESKLIHKRQQVITMLMMRLLRDGSDGGAFSRRRASAYFSRLWRQDADVRFYEYASTAADIAARVRASRLGPPSVRRPRVLSCCCTARRAYDADKSQLPPVAPSRRHIRYHYRRLRHEVCYERSRARLAIAASAPRRRRALIADAEKTFRWPARARVACSRYA